MGLKDPNMLMAMILRLMALFGISSGLFAALIAWAFDVPLQSAWPAGLALECVVMGISVVIALKRRGLL